MRKKAYNKKAFAASGTRFVSVLLVSLLLTVFCSAFISTPVMARNLPRFNDTADLVGASAEQAINDKLDRICLDTANEVLILTTYGTGGQDIVSFADDYYDDNGFGYDGILLVIDMQNRDWAISTSGFGITAFTDRGQQYLMDQILDDLSQGYYNECFDKYADLCEDFIKEAQKGTPYDVGHLPKGPFNPLQKLLIALVSGLLPAGVATGAMKSQLHSVGRQHRAANYVKQGSVNIRNEHELFLYSHLTVTRRPKQQSNSGGGSSTHMSSSGHTHGGSHGKF